MPERKCHSCTRQKEWGCDGVKVLSHEKDYTAEKEADGKWWGWKNPSHMPMSIDGEQIWCCPRRDIKDRGREWAYMLKFYGFWQKGHLPQEGGIMDQSNKALELFRILDQINGECDAAENERRAAGQQRDNSTRQRPPARGR